MGLKTLHKAVEVKRTLSILKNIHVKHGIATGTDIDVQYSTPTVERMKMGMYHRDGFKDGIHLLNKECKVEDFPFFNDGLIDGKPLAEIIFDREQMRVLEWVAKAQSTEETRYYLNGVFFDNNGIVATDGHRLHQAFYPAKWNMKDTPVNGVILPRRAIKLFIDGMKETKAGSATVHLWETGAVITFGKTTIKTKTIDGTYPNYERVVPKIYKTKKCPFSAKEIAHHKAIVNATMKACDLGKSMPVHFVENQKLLKFGRGEHESELVISTKLPYLVGFNYKFLCDMNEGDVYFSDASSPHVVKGIHEKTGIQTMGVLMPLRI